MAGKVTEHLRGLPALTVPEDGMAVERGKIGPDALPHPAGVIYQALALRPGRTEHRELSGRQRIVGREHAAGMDGMAERPLPALGNVIVDGDRDRGEPRGSSPPTPPGIRVRTTAVRSS